MARLVAVTRTCQIQHLNAVACLTAAIRSHRRHQAVASLYPTLYRLEKRSLIVGRWLEKAGQRRRRYYRLTPAGRSLLAAHRQGNTRTLRTTDTGFSTEDVLTMSLDVSGPRTRLRDRTERSWDDRGRDRACRRGGDGFVPLQPPQEEFQERFGSC